MSKAPPTTATTKATSDVRQFNVGADDDIASVRIHITRIEKLPFFWNKVKNRRNEICRAEYANLIIV